SRPQLATKVVLPRQSERPLGRGIDRQHIELMQSQIRFAVNRTQPFRLDMAQEAQRTDIRDEESNGQDAHMRTRLSPVLLAHGPVRYVIGGEQPVRRLHGRVIAGLLRNATTAIRRHLGSYSNQPARASAVSQWGLSKLLLGPL